jgi:hypothetical protein
MIHASHPPRLAGAALRVGVPLRAATAGLLAAVLAGSVLAGGFYDIAWWGSLAIALAVVVPALLWAGAGAPGRGGAIALGALAGLTAWAALSMTWAESVDRAWTETNRWGLYLLILATTLLTVRSVRVARFAVAVLAAVVALLVVGIAGRLALAGDAGLFRDFRLDGPLGYINGEAGFLLIGLWLFLGLAEPGRPAALRGTAVGLAVLDADLLVLTQSRAVLPAVVASVAFVLIAAPGRLVRAWTLVATVAGVAVTLRWQLDVYAARGTGAAPAPGLLHAAGRAALAGAIVAGACWTAVCARTAGTGPRARRLAAAALALIALAGLGAAGASAPLDRARDQYHAFVRLQPDEQAGSRFLTGGGNRYELWRVAVTQFRDRPLAGLGAGNYATTYYRERRITEPVRQPHSLPLQTLAELGLVGGILLAALLGVVLLTGMRPRAGSVAAADRGVHVAALGAFVAWLAQTSVDWLHLLPGMTGVALLCAGLLLAGGDRGGGQTIPTPDARRRRAAAVGLASIAIALLAASSARQLAADHYRHRAAAALATDPPLALARARQAIALDAAAPEGYYLRAAAAARMGDADAAGAALTEAARREPSNDVPRALLGDLAVREGDRGRARREYRRAARLNPRDPALQALAHDPPAAPASPGAR